MIFYFTAAMIDAAFIALLLIVTAVEISESKAVRAVFYALSCAVFAAVTAGVVWEAVS